MERHSAVQQQWGGAGRKRQKRCQAPPWGLAVQQQGAAVGRVVVLMVDVANWNTATALSQVVGLAVQAGGSGGHFLHQGGVLLGDLIHVGHGFADLAHALALLLAGGADFAHQDHAHAQWIAPLLAWFGLPCRPAPYLPVRGPCWCRSAP